MNRFRLSINKFFTKGSKRTLEAKKNIAGTIVIKGISIAINLAIVPLTIHYVNPSKYGIWLTLSSIIGWISFFDIGFGNGLRNRFAEAKANENYGNARTYVSTTYIILTILFTIVWILFLIINTFLNWSEILNVSGEMAVSLSKLALIVVSFFCLQMILKTINTIIIADQKPSKASFFDMLGQLVALIGIFFLIKTTKGSLIYLGLVFSVAPTIMLIISSIWFYSNDYKYFLPSIKYFQISYAKDIIHLGSKFFLIQIGVVVIYQTNNILIAHIGNMEDVASYNIANKYLGLMVMAFSIIMSPFWSAFTEAFSKKDFQWMLASYKRLKYISYVGIIGIIFFMLISKFVYIFWIGKSILVPISITIIVGIYNILLIQIWLYTTLLNGMGKIKIQTIVYFLAIAFHIPLAILLGRNIGVIGVILSSSLFLLIIVLFTSKQVDLLLKRKATQIWNE